MAAERADESRRRGASGTCRRPRRLARTWSAAQYSADMTRACGRGEVRPRGSRANRPDSRDPRPDPQDAGPEPLHPGRPATRTTSHASNRLFKRSRGERREAGDHAATASCILRGHRSRRARRGRFARPARHVGAHSHNSLNTRKFTGSISLPSASCLGVSRIIGVF